jgi:hypothetical protein
MLSNESLLAVYEPRDFCTIHVIDTDPNAVNVDDVSSVDKYVIPEEKYADRDDTFRKFKAALPTHKLNDSKLTLSFRLSSLLRSRLVVDAA